MGQDTQKENVTKAPDPEMLKNLGFLRDLEMMEMVVDTGLDKKMKPAPKEPKTEGKTR